MTTLTVFVIYAVITGLALVTARVAMYLLLGRYAVPERPPKNHLPDCAGESLRRATELRIDATAVYNQLSGRMQHR